MKHVNLAFALVLLVTGTAHADGAQPFKKLDNDEQLRKIFVEHSQLKDPFTVQFRNAYVRDVRIDTKDAPVKHVYCGEFNAKNGYGSYSGWSRFLVEDVIDEPTVTIGDDESGSIMVNLLCKDAPNGG